MRGFLDALRCTVAADVAPPASSVINVVILHSPLTRD
jgi:hypothetical protein